MLSDPVSDRADDVMVEQLLTSLTSLSSSKQASIGGNDLSLFGLDRPKRRLRLYEASELVLDIRLGSDVVVGSGVYLCTPIVR